MKKLNKLQINPERIMKNAELITLRGGYGYVTCYNGGTVCGEWSSGPVGDCSMAHAACDMMCSNWTNAICVG